MVFNLAETLKEMENEILLAKEEGRSAKAEGKAEGMAEGIEKGIVKVAKNLLVKNITLDLIAEVTGLSIEQIKKLKTKNIDKTH